MPVAPFRHTYNTTEAHLVTGTLIRVRKGFSMGWAAAATRPSSASQDTVRFTLWAPPRPLYDRPIVGPL